MKKYLVARLKCGCVATALFYPLDGMDSLKEFISDCMNDDLIIESRFENVTVGAERCPLHEDLFKMTGELPNRGRDADNPS